MALTEKQKQRIARYLHDVHEHLDGADERSRLVAERKIRGQIEDALQRHGSAVTRDEHLDSALAALGTPAQQAALYHPSRAVEAAWAPVTADRRWLGVCGGIARELQVDPLVVRGIVLFLGLITLPFSLWVYLAAYGVMGFALQMPAARERIEPAAVFKAVWPPALVALLIHLVIVYTIDGIDWLLTAFAGFNLMAVDSRWTWFADGPIGIFLWALLFVLPLAALSAMSVRPDWRPTFKKLAQASVAVYSVYAAYGLGSLLAGTGIHLATRYDGPTLSELAQNLTLPF